MGIRPEYAPVTDTMIMRGTAQCSDISVIINHKTFTSRLRWTHFVIDFLIDNIFKLKWNIIGVDIFLIYTCCSEKYNMAINFEPITRLCCFLHALYAANNQRTN